MTLTDARPLPPLPLLLLGRGVDPASERGVDCPGELPAASDPTLVAAPAAKAWATGCSSSATTTSATR